METILHPSTLIIMATAPYRSQSTPRPPGATLLDTADQASKSVRVRPYGTQKTFELQIQEVPQSEVEITIWDTFEPSLGPDTAPGE